MQYIIKQYLKIVERNNLELKNCPKGRLVRYSDSIRYYHVVRNKKTGIDKRKGITNNKELIYSLARKKYLLVQNKLLLETISKIKRQGTYVEPIMPNDVIKLLPHSYDKLPLEAFLPNLKFAHEWANEKFEQCKYKLEDCTLRTERNDNVRSKSEVIISDVLADLKMFYRYECALPCGNKKYYPDFTIYNPDNDKIYYLEHFGLMDNPDYVEKSLGKINHITRERIAYLGDNLIVTYESDIANRENLVRMLKYRLSI